MNDQIFESQQAEITKLSNENSKYVKKVLNLKTEKYLLNSYTQLLSCNND